MAKEKPNLFGKLLQNENMYKASTIVEDMAEKVPQRKPFLPTSPSMAWSTAVGHYFGTMELLYGPKSSGKTMLALDRIKTALAQDSDSIAVFVDAELDFEFDSTVRWMKANGVDTDRVLIVREVNIKTIFETKILRELRDAIKDEKNPVKVGVIVFDSIAAMGVKDMKEGSMNKKQMEAMTKQDFGARANYLARIFPFFRQFVRDFRPYVVFINQARFKGEDFFGNPVYDTNGGEALYHEVQYRYLIIKDEAKPIFGAGTSDAQGKEVQIGQRSKWICQKNKMGEGLGRQGHIDMIFMKGIVNVEEELAELCPKLGIIEQKGAWYYYKDEKFNGTAQFAEYLKSNPQAYKELMGAVMMDASNSEKYS